MLTSRSPLLLLLSALYLLFSLCSCHIGRRFLEVEIAVDDQVVMQGHYSVADTTPIAEMWNVLEHVPFEVLESDRARVRDGDRSLELDGEVEVRIRHVDRELTSATVPNLTMTRAGDTTTWSLSQDDFTRVLQAAAQ